MRVENVEDALRNLVNAADTLDGLQLAGAFVMGDQRRGLLFVDGQALADGVLVVVGTAARQQALIDLVEVDVEEQRAVERVFRASASIASSASAWASVRGKPSSRKPADKPLFMRSSIMPSTISSDTSPPASMIALAFLPSSVPAATSGPQQVAGRDMGDAIARNDVLRLRALPEPGAPNNTILSGIPILILHVGGSCGRGRIIGVRTGRRR